MHRVDRGDVRVVQRGEQLGLALEARQPVRVRGKILGQDLDRHLTVERGVQRPPHHAHPARAELLDETVVRQHLTGSDRHRANLRWIG